MIVTAARHDEVDRVQGDPVAEAFGQRAGLDRGAARHARIPVATQRENAATITCGQAPSHGIEPCSTRSRIS